MNEMLDKEQIRKVLDTILACKTKISDLEQHPEEIFDALDHMMVDNMVELVRGMRLITRTKDRYEVDLTNLGSVGSNLSTYSELIGRALAILHFSNSPEEFSECELELIGLEKYDAEFVLWAIQLFYYLQLNELVSKLTTIPESWYVSERAEKVFSSKNIPEDALFAIYPLPSSLVVLKLGL